MGETRRQSHGNLRRARCLHGGRHVRGLLVWNEEGAGLGARRRERGRVHGWGREYLADRRRAVESLGVCPWRGGGGGVVGREVKRSAELGKRAGGAEGGAFSQRGWGV